MHECIDYRWAAPDKWFVVFHKRATRRWINWLAMGRYKHVSAFGFCEVASAWVLIDATLRRTELVVVPDRLMTATMAKLIGDADVVEIEPQDRGWPLIGLFCVSTIRHVLGLPGCALRPDALYRQCLANGGRILSGEHHGSQRAEGQQEAAPAGAEAA